MAQYLVWFMVQVGEAPSLHMRQLLVFQPYPRLGHELQYGWKANHIRMPLYLQETDSSLLPLARCHYEWPLVS